jgi:hypothetical protein
MSQSWFCVAFIGTLVVLFTPVMVLEIPINGLILVGIIGFSLVVGALVGANFKKDYYRLPKRW